jgi:hypothetical protein
MLHIEDMTGIYRIDVWHLFSDIMRHICMYVVNVPQSYCLLWIARPLFEHDNSRMVCDVFLAFMHIHRFIAAESPGMIRSSNFR